jgi:predicted dehydrogenase
MTHQQPIRIALIGAGIFAREAHVPALLRLHDRFRVVAVYSRTPATAQGLAALLPQPVMVTTDLADLLANPEIDAFDLLVPIDVLPAITELVLATGKPLISEKPIAPDVSTAQRLIASWQADRGQVWMVGENWRYESAFVQAAEMVKAGDIGRPLTCWWALHPALTPASKYYFSEWRRSGRFSGGLLLDGGVHHMAALRLILGEVAAVTAIIQLMTPDLPPADTLSATLLFANGTVASYLACYAANAPWPPQLQIVGDAGALRVDRGLIERTLHGKQTETILCPARDGVDNELLAFADAVQHAMPHRNTPQQGLLDVELVQALLESAQRATIVRPDYSRSTLISSSEPVTR